MSTEKKDHTTNVNRREFINKSGQIAAVAGAVITAPAINVMGANEVLRLGIIGSGKRGRYLMTQAMNMSRRKEEGKEKDLEFVACADAYEDWRYQGVDIAERVTDKCTPYETHTEMLEKEKLDGVIVATPEHLHYRHAADVISAGVDMYLEKPMVHTYQEGKKLLQAIKGKDIVIQVGTQRRSVPLYKQAHDLIKAGAIGQVNFVEGWWNRNFPKTHNEPAWLYEIPEDADEETCDWEAFLGSAPKTDFNLQRYFQWRCYWDYSNGIGSDLMVHQIDAINSVMGTGMPKSIIASGGIYRWKDHRETPDVWSAILEYEEGLEGFQVNYHARFTNTTDNSRQYGISMFGSDGAIEITLYHKMKLIPEDPGLRNIKDMEAQEWTYGDSSGQANDLGVRDHIENWYDCVKSRKETNCPVLTGFHGAAIAHMSIMSFKSGKKVSWDKNKMEATTA